MALKKIHLNLIFLSIIMMILLFCSYSADSAAVAESSVSNSRKLEITEGSVCFMHVGPPCKKGLVCCNEHCLPHCGSRH